MVRKQVFISHALLPLAIIFFHSVLSRTLGILCYDHSGYQCSPKPPTTFKDHFPNLSTHSASCAFNTNGASPSTHGVTLNTAGCRNATNSLFFTFPSSSSSSSDSLICEESTLQCHCVTKACTSGCISGANFGGKGFP